MLKAVTRQASHVDAKIAALNSSRETKISTAYFFDHYAEKEDVAVMVTMEDFLSAERELVPSVSLKELEHYKRVRAMFEKPVEEGKGRLGIEEGKRSNGKGKGGMVDRKGKGKAAGDEDEDEDEFYSGGAVNGSGKGKGKGKAVDRGFQEGTLEDEEGVY